MTEKDAVKCLPLLQGGDAADLIDRCWTLPVRAELPEAFWVALLERILHPATRAEAPETSA